MAQRKTHSPTPRDSLRAYHRKRDLTASGEPVGSAATRTAKLPRFVIQKHDATRLHYDLRLEMDGVYKSWAVPKGLPLVPGDKSLAIEVEDHPLDYGNFEGTIPAGNYGAGTVMLWDRGFYTVEGTSPVDALRRGKIHFALAGEKSLGEWTLVRTRGGQSGKINWLVIKNHDSAGEQKPRVDRERSVLTGRTMDEIAAGAKTPRRRTASDRAKASAATKTARRVASPRPAVAAPEYVEPMKALAVEAVPAGDWQLELKFDGYRAIALLDRDVAALWSRNRNDLTSDYPEVVEALRKLDCGDATLDGELVALDENGRSSFQLMQQRDLRGRRPAMQYFVFDLLHLDGRSLLGETLEVRRTALEKLVGNASDGVVRLSPVFRAEPADLLTAVREKGMEGIVAKRVGSRYEPGRRSGAWLKCRIAREQEFVIGGFTPPQGSRTHFGSLLIGYYDGDQLMCAGKVGSGFDDRLLASLHKKMTTLARRDCPFANLPSAKRSRFGTGLTASSLRGVTWLEPELVCQVRFTEWTDDGSLRHPVFLGLRKDKHAREVIREPLAAK